MLAATTLALLFLAAAHASAATRYAAPGGNDDPGSECLQSHPCSLFNAATPFGPDSKLEEGDEVVVEPGTYSGAAGELGPEASISPPANVSIHGLAGQPRPVIVVNGGNGGAAFSLADPGDTLSHVEILASDNTHPWGLRHPSSVIDGVIAVIRGRDGCFATAGLIRNSVCLSTEASTDALEVFPGKPNTTIELRNLTLVATGANSKGFNASDETLGDEFNVQGIGLLVRGTDGDVFGKSAASAKVNVTLSHSDFATVHEEVELGNNSTVTITKPGKGDANITAAPLLAADGYHELPGSPTIDAGALDPANPSLSGTTDVDGNARSIGAGPDIGADELQLVPTASLSCAPNTVLVGQSSSCTIRVSAPGASPTGTVGFTSDGPGAFGSAGACTLAPAGSGKASCHLPYTPSAVGSGNHKLTASYQGDTSNLASQDSTTLAVLTKSQAIPNTALKKKPARRSAGRKATFTFTSNLRGRFECKLDRKGFKPCHSPLRLKGLKKGRHTFSVRALGPTGAADPTPARFRWTVS